MSLKLAVIESPYAGDIERNTAYARQCLLWAIASGYAPIASHLLYTQVLDDNNPELRSLGIKCGLVWLEKADVQLFFMDLGMSDGMSYAKAIGASIGIRQEFVYLADNKLTTYKENEGNIGHDI